MASIVSGLGRLFHPASSSLSPHTPRGQRQLESVTEEAHTYDLLYPEAVSLQNHQHHAFPLRHGDPSSIAAAATSSDDRGGLNIQHPRDVRFIVGQYIGGHHRVLFDTQPPLLPSATRKSLDREINEQMTEDLRRHGNMQRSRTAPHTRQSSSSQTGQSIFGLAGLPLSPVNEMGGLFGRENRRPNTSDGETLQAQEAKEERQETDAMLSSMFGATGHRILAGTKIHIRPYSPSQPEVLRPVSPGTTRQGSQRRRTPLTRSTTAEDLQSFVSTQNPDSTIQRASRRQSSSILITRIFYVDSADENLRPTTGDGNAEPANGQSVNMPDAGEKRRSRTLSDDRSRKYRTPAFAIAMVIHMPLPLQQTKTQSSARASPAFGQTNPLIIPESINQLYSEEFDRSVEYVMAHWDTMTRALSSLEVIIRCEVSSELSQLDVNIVVPPVSPPASGPNSRLSRMRALPLPALELPHGALQQSSAVQQAIDMTGKRVVSALQIHGVAVGQGRWGVWREEARGVGKWAGGWEQNFFLFNLLTAFLGNHTEWLDLMSPKLKRGKRSGSRDRVQQQQHEIIRHRTVIVSLDKMAARRLIFLLSAFLSPSQANPRRYDAAKSDASTSVPASSTSPLIASPISRRLSLRKTLSKSQLGSGYRSEHEVAVADTDVATEASDDRTITGSSTVYRKDGHQQHTRRASDAVSIRSVALPITTAGPRFRTASTTTTATVLPESAIPVAHFSSFLPEPRSSMTGDQRPGSSGSIASLALHRTLSRSDSVDHSGTSADSQSTGRWFWTSRRGSSTETSETPTSSAEGLGISVPKELHARRPTDRLSQMVEDVSAAPVGQNTSRTHNDGIHECVDTSSRPSPPKDIAQAGDTIEPFPLDLSVNESDGVIDVKLPSLDSHASSFGSITSSPGASRTNPGDLREQLRPPSPSLSTAPTLHQQRRSHSISEVAGWLRRFHQDLTLQALQPYDTLKEEIKYAMRTEPAPVAIPQRDGHEKSEEWTDVCTSLIADITTFTLTRLTLRRKNAFSSYHQADALLGRSTKDSLEEKFVEESLIDHDATLTEAVEKILSHSGQSSHLTSRGPSCAASRSNSPSRMTALSGESTPALEIPKSECKNMVLGALEQVAKGVRSELSGAPKSKDQDGSDAKDTLREGVRRWFEEVELMAR